MYVLLAITFDREAVLYFLQPVEFHTATPILWFHNKLTNPYTLIDCYIFCHKDVQVTTYAIGICSKIVFQLKWCYLVIMVITKDRINSRGVDWYQVC